MPERVWLSVEGRTTFYYAAHLCPWGNPEAAGNNLRTPYVRADKYAELRRLAEAASAAHDKCVENIWEDDPSGDNWAPLHVVRLKAMEALRDFLKQEAK